MNWFSRSLAAAGVIALSMAATAAEPAPSFKEVLDLLKAHLVDAEAGRLDQAATEGLLRQLSPLVSLVTNAPAEAEAGGPGLAKASVCEGAYGYLRVAAVTKSLPSELESAMKGLAQTNKLKGWLLDLRFCDGTDYQAAAAAGDRFAGADEALIDYGQGMIRSTAKEDPVKLPVMALINRQTTQAAEALAAILHKTDAALLLGTNTAGQAFVTRSFPLQTGGQLRIATAIIKTGDGQPLSREGVKPDILVSANPADERAYLDDPYKLLVRTTLRAAANDTNQLASTTNRSMRPRINEADLVRILREGGEYDMEGAPGRLREPARPVLRDPVLARAVDLLKGLAVVKRAVR
jgi:hypothetical protein